MTHAKLYVLLLLINIVFISLNFHFEAHSNESTQSIGDSNSCPSQVIGNSNNIQCNFYPPDIEIPQHPSSDGNIDISNPPVSSYFDGTGMDGWSVNLGSLNNPGSNGAGGGSNNGYIQTRGPSEGRTSYYIAPRKYHGDWRDYSNLKLELQSSGGSYYSSGYGMYGDIFIGNGRQGAQFFFQSRPSSNWETFVIPLESSSDWTFSGGASSLEEILSNVVDLHIRAEYGVGNDRSGLDNVELLVAE